MSNPLLRKIPPEQASRSARVPVPPETLVQAKAIVEDVWKRGEEAVREHAVRLGDLGPEDPLIKTRGDLEQAAESLPSEQHDLLLRTAARIHAFAEAQRNRLSELTCDVPGGKAGHRVIPVERAGCYAPGGRFPLPSSVLMTAVTARTAGVDTVWVASPRPTAVTLAACAVAGADGLLMVGGAQAIAALAFGAGSIPQCDVVVGPGNRYVTAAKQLVSGRIGIDMLAGPSELLVIADASADPALIAADLLAQAEHDPDAVPMIISLDAAVIDAVEKELNAQLADLPTAQNARAALANGFAVTVPDIDTAVRLSDRIAPEHLEVLTKDADRVADQLSNWGSLFIGPHSAEVLADYGAGPNHVLPTGGTARIRGGLSVFNFLKTATWLRIENPADAAELTRDAVALSRLEGLEAHARAAERRQR